jgi:hypothetical protein
VHKFSWTGWALVVVSLAGCGTVPVDLLTVESARFLHEDNRRNLACDIPVPWVNINRGSLGEPMADPRPLSPELPRAGFRTAYVRGAEPIPCERQVYQRTDTVFQFDFRDFLTRYRPEQIELALLSVEEVQTERDVLVRFAEPWLDSGVLEGYTRIDSTSVPFQVKAVRSRWTPMPASAPASPQGRPVISELPDVSPGRAQIAVPLSGATPTYVVTDEVRHFLSPAPGRPQSLGFAVEPAPGRYLQRYKRFNEVNAAFRVRLRLLVRP